MNYCGLWTSRFPTEEAKNKGLQQWASQLTDFSAEELKKAIGLCLKRLSEPPTLAKFRELADLARAELKKPYNEVLQITAEPDSEADHRAWLASNDWRDILMREYQRLGSLDKARESMKEKKIYPFV